MDKAREVDCWACGGRGRPFTRAEAAEAGMAYLRPPVTAVERFEDRPPCTYCRGTGRALPYGSRPAPPEWRSANWGTNSDAMFSDSDQAVPNDASVEPRRAGTSATSGTRLGCRERPHVP